MTIVCPQCGESEFEKRASRRCYFVLDEDLNEDSWTHGDLDAMDSDEEGNEIIYCVWCDSEFTEKELRAGQRSKPVPKLGTEKGVTV